jgi:hypothetical protein
LAPELEKLLLPLAAFAPRLFFGVLPPVDLRAVCFVLAIQTNEQKGRSLLRRIAMDFRRNFAEMKTRFCGEDCQRNGGGAKLLNFLNGQIAIHTEKERCSCGF